MSIIRSLVVLVLLSSLAVRADVSSNSAEDWDAIFNSDVTLEQTDEVISQMSLPQKIGQLFF